MNWKYLVLEGYCTYEKDIFANVACCNCSPGSISLLCLENSVEKKMCQYFGFKRARSCLILANNDGEEIQNKCFSCDDEVDEKKWLENEKKWLDEWKKKLE